MLRKLQVATASSSDGDTAKVVSTESTVFFPRTYMQFDTAEWIALPHSRTPAPRRLSSSENIPVTQPLVTNNDNQIFPTMKPEFVCRESNPSSLDVMVSGVVLDQRVAADYLSTKIFTFPAKTKVDS